MSSAGPMESFGPDVPVRAGDVVGERYRVERLLGRGAMGVVVAVRHLELHELRAMKLMLPSGLSGTDGVERFMREARAAVRLKSPNVAQVLDVGRLPTGLPYLVMEYLEGADLKSVMDGRALPVPEAIGYCIQVCQALSEAHALGIVHRDIKPANLFLAKTPTGQSLVKVLDFGVAKVFGAQDGEATGSSWCMGTPSYMAPEQMRSARDVDGRADVWSVGAVLYRMLSGQLPFPGGPMDVAGALAAQIRPRALGRPDVPPELEAIVFGCLEFDHQRRIPSVAALGQRLSQIAAQLSAGAYAHLPAAPASYPGLPASAISMTGPQQPNPGTISYGGSMEGPRAPEPKTRSPWPWIAGGAVVVAAVATTVVILKVLPANNAAAAGNPQGNATSGTTATTAANPPASANARTEPAVTPSAAALAVPSASVTPSASAAASATADPAKTQRFVRPPSDAFGDSRK